MGRHDSIPSNVLVPARPASVSNDESQVTVTVYHPLTC